MNAKSFQRLAAALIRHAPGASATEPHLRAAIHQLAATPGKLVRPQLVLAGAMHHGLRGAAAERLACAVEYFHTASLVLDDLPCMDDAALRRNRPCVHRQHGDATAILAALAFINRAYSLVGDALAAEPRSVRVKASACLDRSLGVAGLVGGQAWDLAFAETDRSARTVGMVAAAKTGALFELAILLPATLARPTRAEWRSLRALCLYWGQGFQIADDLRDVLAASYEAGKTTGRDRLLGRPNLAYALGVPAARARLRRLSAQSATALARLTAGGGRRWHYLAAAGAALSEVMATVDEAQSAAA
ncbi:polyprenyl synthetase family protein [Horticoccus sp. 23ND18S-11]|uniref:polyprenyl synthetase family protein n=1 Tax=Horticoccus sp. 23ND18S-11 TaxID=3391832 RepID=UPI0039C91AC5